MTGVINTTVCRSLVGWLRRFLGGGREVVHRGKHAAAGQRDTGEFQTHFDAGEGRHQGQVIAVAKVTDAEHAPFQLAQPGPEGEVA